MASAICGSLSKNKGFDFEISVFDRKKHIAGSVKKKGVFFKEIPLLVKESDFVFVCVKPKDLDEVLHDVKDCLQDKVLVSIAAGKSISQIKKVVGEKKIVRVMPNISAIAAKSVNAFAAVNLSDKEKSAVRLILDCFGKSYEIKENEFDCVTALSGCGPAFVAYFMEKFSKAGEENGLEAEFSKKITLDTFDGTVSLLRQGLSFQEIIEQVSSPEGATVAGRKILESGWFEKMLKDTIGASKKRAQELSKQ